MQILYKSILEDTVVHAGECYLVGAEFTHTGTNDLVIYDEGSATTASRKVMLLKGGSPTVSIMFPLPGIKCSNIFADWTAGTGTVYYYL